MKKVCYLDFSKLSAKEVESHLSEVSKGRGMGFHSGAVSIMVQMRNFVQEMRKARDKVNHDEFVAVVLSLIAETNTMQQELSTLIPVQSEVAAPWYCKEK